MSPVFTLLLSLFIAALIFKFMDGLAGFFRGIMKGIRGLLGKDIDDDNRSH